MHAGALLVIVAQTSVEVVRMLGIDRESKFPEVAPSIVKYGMDNVDNVDTASVRRVQWNKDLEGEQRSMHAKAVRPLTAYIDI